MPHPTLVLWTSDNPGTTWQEAEGAADAVAGMALFLEEVGRRAAQEAERQLAAEPGTPDTPRVRRPSPGSADQTGQ